MQHGASAYAAVATKTANPRELEATLLLKAASRLQAIKDGWDARKGDLHEALTYNRKLWTVFVTAVAQDDHQLPKAVRENVANIGLFVMNHTVAVLQEPQPQKLGALISINREIAAGLMGR
jgi:flagellar biosynthesis activator protein FlaF